MKKNHYNRGFIRYLSLFLIFILVITIFNIHVSDIVESWPVQLAIEGTKRAWTDYWQPGFVFTWEHIILPVWHWGSGFFSGHSSAHVVQSATSTVSVSATTTP